MAQLMFAPVFQAVDANGAPYSGALLYTYTAGTTTPLTSYQDNGLITPHLNPVVADTAGRFAPVYFANTSVKVVLKTAAGVTITTVDPIVYSTGRGFADTATATLLQLSDYGLTLGKANTAFTVAHADDDSSLTITGGKLDPATGVLAPGGSLSLYGPSHASLPNEYALSAGAATKYAYTASLHKFTDAVVPSSAATYDLGSTALYWRTIYLGASNVIIKAGSGSPESVVSAGVGSIYMRTNGGAGTSIYVKESGSGNTGWIAK